MSERRIVERWAIERRAPGAAAERREVTFSEPWFTSEHNWRCAVDLPFMDHAPFEIIGVDAAQAKELARWFANDLLKHHGWRRL
jgi:hypothetical protein